MVINYDIKKINEVLNAFYNATGINISMLKDDFSPISENQRVHNDYCRAIQAKCQGKSMCKNSDKKLLSLCRESKKAEMHICHAGLVDIAVPILYEDSIIGYIILGQMKNSGDFSAVEDRVKKLGLESAEMKRYYSELSFFDSEKIKSVETISVMMTKYLLLENMLKPDFNLNIKRVTDFINENLDKNLNISYISKSVNISKSVLYRNFHSCFNCTLSEYINKVRVKRAEKLLKESEMSIEDVARCVGFSSVSYFSRVFKEKKGISPLAFRKMQA